MKTTLKNFLCNNLGFYAGALELYANGDKKVMDEDENDTLKEIIFQDLTLLDRIEDEIDFSPIESQFNRVLREWRSWINMEKQSYDARLMKRFNFVWKD